VLHPSYITDGCAKVSFSEGCFGFVGKYFAFGWLVSFALMLVACRDETPKGVVSTFSSSGAAGFAADEGSAAQFNWP